MNGRIQSVERRQLRPVPDFRVGDRVRVHFQVVEGTPADTATLRSAGGDMLRGAFEPGLSLEHARKDALLIIEAARDAGVEPLLTEVMLERIERALRLGHGGRAYTSIYLGVRG